MDMMQEYDFNNVGKKMPYAMPDEGFFAKIQENVLAQVDKDERGKRKRKTKLIRLYVSAASIAACVCIAVLVGRSFMSSEITTPQPASASVALVDEAYDNLSFDEQQELNATYANDVYLCME